MAETKNGGKIERGKVISVANGLYTVASFDRDGIEVAGIPAVDGSQYEVGETVHFVSFPDGTGWIACGQDATAPASGSVTGVKGNAESEYRTGKVNLTPANIGALPLAGGTLTGNLSVVGSVSASNGTLTSVSFSRNLTSGTKIGTITIDGTETDLYCQTNTNTTYTLATGDSNGQIKVTPSSGTAYNVSVKGLGSAAYTASTDYAPASHTHSYLPLTGGTVSGSIAISATGKGFNLTDSSGTTYGGIYDNGNNLWIGATSSTSPHHRGANGNTYISAGYNTSSAAGNSTIYISVPSLSGITWSHTSYGVLHTGNYSSYALPLSGGTLTGNLYIGNGSDTTNRIIGCRTSISAIELNCYAPTSTTYQQGLFDRKNNSWILYNSDANTVTIPRTIYSVRATSSWVYSIAHPAHDVNYSGTSGAIIGMTMRTKNGYVGIGTYPTNDDRLYVYYITKADYDGNVNTVTQAKVFCDISGHADGDLALTGGTLSGNLTFSTTTDNGIIQGYNGTTKYTILRNHGNGNVSISACGAGMYVGYTNSTFVNFLNGKMSLNSQGSLTIVGQLSTGGKGTGTDGKAGTILSSTGNLYLQHTSGSNIYFFYGTSTSSTARLYESASGTLRVSSAFTVDGIFRSPSTWSNTTTNSANVRVIDQYGQFQRYSSSSKRYKHDIKPIKDYKSILDIPVVTFKYNDGYVSESDQRHGLDIPGFIAEEVEKLYPIAAEYVDGKIEDWNARYIIPPLLAVEQDHEKRIAALEAEIKALKGVA